MGYTLRKHHERKRTEKPLHTRGLQHQHQPGDFEKAFTKTKETVRFTFNGWDGKSYHGESRNARVLRCTIPGFEGIRFIKVGKGTHFIDEESLVTEQATGEKHPEANWLVDVRKA